MKKAASSVLVVRGDLISSSGYAKAARLYCGYLERRYDAVLGIDLYRSSTDDEPWLYPLVKESAIKNLLDMGSDVHVYTIAKPEHYRPFPGARHTATFFWETDRIRDYSWVDWIDETVDELWMPAQYLRETMIRAGVSVPVKYVPTPTTSIMADTVEPSVARSRAFSILVTPAVMDADSSVSLAQVRQSSDILFGTIGTAIPRKGFAVLFEQWRQMKAEVAELAEAALVVKTGTIDVTQSPEQVTDEMCTLARDVAGPASDSIYVVADHLSDVQIGALHASLDAFVTTSFGEGFGLGVFESLEHGVPVLCPRHTSFVELLPDDYPFFLDTDYYNVGLADPAGVYPMSASWGVPKEGSLSLIAKRWLDERDTVASVVSKARSHQAAVTLSALGGLK